MDIKIRMTKGDWNKTRAYFDVIFVGISLPFNLTIKGCRLVEGKDGLFVSPPQVKKDEEYLKIMIKSEIAGNKWGRDELWGVRIATDSQIMGALNHFNEADAFLVQSN